MSFHLRIPELAFCLISFAAVRDGVEHVTTEASDSPPIAHKIMFNFSEVTGGEQKHDKRTENRTYTKELDQRITCSGPGFWVQGQILFLGGVVCLLHGPLSKKKANTNGRNLILFPSPSLCIVFGGSKFEESKPRVPRASEILGMLLRVPRMHQF